MLVKVNGKTSETITEHLSEFPFFALRCKLGKILKDRGLTMQELSDLSGIRVASISELVNMKRSTVSVPHIVVIAKVLRINDISELFEFIMPKDTAKQFEQDQRIIEVCGMLPEQDKVLSEIRYENNLIKAFNKKVRQIERAKKKEEEKRKKEEEEQRKQLELELAIELQEQENPTSD